MNEAEYKALVDQYYSGKVLIGIDRSIARSFFTELPLAVIEEKTGEAPFFEKIVVKFAFFSAPLALFTSFVLSVLAFNWWAAIAIPLSIMIYVVFSGLSSMPKTGILGILLMFAFSISFLFTNIFSSSLTSWYFITVTFSLLMSRLLYKTAHWFLRAFVLRNQRAFEFMSDNIHFIEAEHYSEKNGLKYLFMPISIFMWYLTAYYGLQFAIMGMLFMFALNPIWSLIMYIPLIGIVFIVLIGFPRLFRFLIFKYYGKNWISCITHSFAGLAGFIPIIHSTIVTQHNPGNGYKPSFILSRMWEVAPYKTLFLLFAFIGFIISLFWSTVIAPVYIKQTMD